MLEDQITEHWSAEWMNIAQKEKNHLEEMESLIETAARKEASKNFARIAARQFGAKTTLAQENPFKTLQLLILPLREFIISESAAGNDVDMELRKLEEIWKWLLDNNPTPPMDAESGGQS
jgi:rubrerythrin